MENSFRLDTKTYKYKGFIDSFWLKLIAIFAMTVDHVAAAFGPILFNENFNIYWLMRFFGRLTFPIMAFLLVQGFIHTSNIRKYAGRLLIFALISIVPYFLLFHYSEALTFNNILENLLLNNVLFTLFIGLIMLYFVKKTNNFLLEIGIVIAAMLLSYFSDWGVIGPLIIYIFYKIKNPWLATIVNFAFFAIDALIDFFIDYQDTIANSGMNNTAAFNWLFDFHSINFGFALAILVIGLYNGQRGLNNNFIKLGYYWFYPVHLLVLFLIKMLIV